MKIYCLALGPWMVYDRILFQAYIDEDYDLPVPSEIDQDYDDPSHSFNAPWEYEDYDLPSHSFN